MLSSCLDAWLKYRPSVARAAFSKVMTAVPAEPEKPDTNSEIVSVTVLRCEQKTLTSASITRSDIFRLVAVFGWYNLKE